VYADDWRRSALKWASQRLLSNADIVVTISNATRNAVLRNYQLDPSSVIVIRSPSRVELHEKNGEFEIDHAPERFVLMVTNSLPHKNTAFACRALIAAGIQRRGIALRVVGSLSPEALSLCRDANIQFTVSKNVADAQLRHWYKNSLFLLSPSLDEGHNLPIAEALSLGANVLCSDIAVHREFYDGCVKFFPPTDLPAATRAVESAIEDGGTWKFNLPQTKRSFVEVAAEYKRVFSSIYEAERK
jgi:glycosyltransferase involved in cell wall biosynthesis